MILLASGRCDIPAFYHEWFFNRLKEGFLDVRNPYDKHQISRIYLTEEMIDGIVFCTKNPILMLPRLDEIIFPYLFHVTITPYQRDIEPHVIHKQDIIAAIHTLSSNIGSNRIFVRYDPILISPKYSIAYHTRAFERLCQYLQGSIGGIIISFVDDYKNLRIHQIEMQMQPMNEQLMIDIAKPLGKIANTYGIPIQTCAEAIDLDAYGIKKTPCFERQQLSRIFQRPLPDMKPGGVRKNCACIPTVDIGDYNCCNHLCKYCYANYDETKIKTNMQSHDPLSSVLIGHLEPSDQIHIRKEKRIRQGSLF